jgi:hypothetical protein
MASLYEMAQGPQSDIFGAIEAGQNAAYNKQFNQFKLADLARQDQARPLIGQALQGNQGAFSSLAGIDPQSYMDVNKFTQGQAQAKREVQASDMDAIAGAIYAADTPEKYQRAMHTLAQQGFEIDANDMDFNNREIFLNMARGAKGATQADQFNQNLGIDQMNAETSRINATKQGGIGGGEKAPAGFRWTQDGNLEPIKGGPQDPSRSMPNRTLRPTTDQNNAAGFYDRLVEAEAALQDPSVTNAAIDYAGKAAANAPFGIGNYLASPGYQKFDQASRNFINAVLRKESGAAISPSEFDNAKVQYFPQPGDSPEKIAQKAANRATVINAMKRTAAGALQQGQPEQQNGYQGADGITNQDIGGLGNQGGQFNIDQGAIEELAADTSPQARAEFDAVFGEGASAYVLGQ